MCRLKRRLKVLTGIKNKKQSHTLLNTIFSSKFFKFQFQKYAGNESTSRERPKSALYLRLKKREVLKIAKMWTLSEKERIGSGRNVKN